MDFSDIPVPIFNSPNFVRQISSPAAIRKALPEFLPSATIQGPHWHKRNGFKGNGKIYHERMLGECAVLGGDVQSHIEGDEYRVITVNDAVVQATKKYGTAPDFIFEWVGVDGIRTSGIIPFLKDATQAIKHLGPSVIGWDIIHNGEKPYIIEANTSPGVNDATAKRIVDQIRRII